MANPNVYVDPQLGRLVQNYRTGFVRLSISHYLDKNFQEAENALLKMEEIMPSNVIPIPSKQLQYQIAQVYNGVGNQVKMKYHLKELVERTEEIFGKGWTPEIDTMDTFVDSSWYFLRYTSPKYDRGAFDPKSADLWNPVDQYTGGVEHAVMHLLYARFFVKAARDLGLINFDEPFQRLFNQGTIIYKGSKMSKSRGNVIAPDEYVKAVGADVVRTYLMFIGPWEQGGEWSDSGINGAARWLNRVWDTVRRDRDVLPDDGDETADRELDRALHKAIRRVTEDVERFKYNTAISALMEYTNQLSVSYSRKLVSAEKWKNSLNQLLILMSPITPHMSEELWEQLGNDFSIHLQAWPKFDEALAEEDHITLVIQVNGKLRDRILAPVGVIESDATALALESEKVKAHIAGKQMRKIIFVPGRLVNIVAT